MKQKSSKPPRLAEKILLRMRKNGEEFSFLGDMNDYPYRIKIGIEVFIISGLLALTIALMTVIYQTVKAAAANPADTLKYE